MDLFDRETGASVLAEPVYAVWRGYGGEAYKFQLNPVGTQFKTRAGVYLFCHFGADNRLVVDYIGQTDNFAQRIGRDLSIHHQWKEIKAAGATNIATMHVPGSVGERLKVESDLRRVIRPTCAPRFAA